jgi:hypothetical protein
MAKYAFMRGWNQVPKSKMNEVREAIMIQLNLASFSTFYSRLKGIPEPTMSEGEKICEVFAEYGITDVWGE